MVAADLMNDYNGKGGTFNGLLIGFWGVLSTQQCMGEHDEGRYKLQSIVGYHNVSFFYRSHRISDLDKYLTCFFFVILNHV